MKRIGVGVEMGRGCEGKKIVAKGRVLFFLPVYSPATSHSTRVCLP